VETETATVSPERHPSVAVVEAYAALGARIRSSRRDGSNRSPATHRSTPSGRPAQIAVATPPVAGAREDLFEANFRRVEGELAGLRAETGARIAGMEGVMNVRLLGLEGRMVELQGRLLADMDAKLGKQKWSLPTWTFLMWLGTLGFMAAMLRH
jgi:hypothetical protein